MENSMQKKKGKPLKRKRELSLSEEIINGISHGIPALVTLFLIPVLSIRGYLYGGAGHAAGAAIFGVCLFLMFLCSTLYHSMPHHTRYQVVFQILDHICIYLAIAGTYTPVAITLISGWQSTVILAVQWTAVLSGIFYKSIARMRAPGISLAIYLIMGWTALFFLPVFIRKASAPLFWCILSGGLCYTLGAATYAVNKIKYFHALWHLFVLAGAAVHYVGIFFFLFSM